MVQRPARDGANEQQPGLSTMKAKNCSARSCSNKRPHSVEPPVRPTRQIPLINPHAAGIDVGATSHWVCVPEDAVEPDQSYVNPFALPAARIKNSGGKGSGRDWASKYT